MPRVLPYIKLFDKASWDRSQAELAQLRDWDIPTGGGYKSRVHLHQVFEEGQLCRLLSF